MFSVKNNMEHGRVGGKYHLFHTSSIIIISMSHPGSSSWGSVANLGLPAYFPASGDPGKSSFAQLLEFWFWQALNQRCPDYLSVSHTWLLWEESGLDEQSPLPH